MKYYLKLLSLPLGLLVAFITLFIIWRVFNLPPAEKLIEYINSLFNAYGLLVFLVSAFLEGVLIFGRYYPGVFVIFASVVSTSSLPEALLRISIGTAGLVLAHGLNYFLGKYLWGKLFIKFGLKASIEDAKQKLLKSAPVAIFASYWLPSTSALTDTAAGILGMSFKKFIFYSFLASIFWNFLVGFIVYFMGDKALVIATSGGTTELLIQLSIVVVWAGILLIVDFRKKRK